MILFNILYYDCFHSFSSQFFVTCFYMDINIDFQFSGRCDELLCIPKIMEKLIQLMNWVSFGIWKLFVVENSQF